MWLLCWIWWVLACFKTATNHPSSYLEKSIFLWKLEDGPSGSQNTLILIKFNTRTTLDKEPCHAESHNYIFYKLELGVVANIENWENDFEYEHGLKSFSYSLLMLTSSIFHHHHDHHNSIVFPPEPPPAYCFYCIRNAQKEKIMTIHRFFSWDEDKRLWRPNVNVFHRTLMRLQREKKDNSGPIQLCLLQLGRKKLYVFIQTTDSLLRKCR